MKITQLQIPFEHLILFDGVCNLCNGLTTFLIRHDRLKKLHFSALQSSLGQQILSAVGLPNSELNTVVYIYRKQVFFKSSAVLRLMTELSGAWKLLYPLILVPRPLRDFVYDLVARNRYRWFGKKDACMMPTPDIKDRFVE